MLKGFNHLTLAVRDLERSFEFYRHVLGAHPHARWDDGAYLSLGTLWICLSLDPKRTASPSADYTHYAFSIDADAFVVFAEHLSAHRVPLWRSNRSEGDSIYFLDPDRHRLEAHVGDLLSRLAACRERPYAGMRFFD